MACAQAGRVDISASDGRFMVWAVAVSTMAMLRIRSKGLLMKRIN
jgi:hypothetical protein